MKNITEAEVSSFDYCVNGVPYFREFLGGIDGVKLLVVVFPAVCVILVWWMFSKNLTNLIANCPKAIKPNCISLISIYPIVSVCSLVAILVPRAYFFMDTVGHLAFMLISYQLYR
jgi:hypothetical protein